MSDSDDDVLLGFKPIGSLPEKRERAQTKRLVAEAPAESGSDDEFDLAKLAAESTRNSKKAQKLGFETNADYRAKAMAPAPVDWDYINGNRNANLPGGAAGGAHSADALEDDDGDGDGDDDEGDDDGRVRNIYAGARAVLGRQASVWPAASDLVFNAPAALAEDPVRFAPLKGCFYALARLSATAAGLAVGPPSPSSSSSSSSSSAASAAVGELAELLGRPSNGIADLLVAAAAAEPPCGAAPLLPQKLWRWLLDVAAFHASDLVGSAAAACALRIVASLPPLGATADGAAAGDEGQGWKEVWDPSRPLSFGLCCRPLVALGLDPMADDPTTPLDRHGAASGSLDGMGGLRAAAAPPFAQPLFPGPALARCVAVWAACFASNRHALSGEESVDLFACLALIGVDPWALSVPNLLVKRDECLRCLLRVLPTTPPDMPADDADGDGGGGGVGVAVWPAGAVRRVAALVRAAPFADTKLLLLRSLPLASTQGRGQVLLAKCACDFADEAFPARSKSPPPPAATAAADAAAGTGAAAASVAASEAEQVAAAGAMATRLLCEEYKSEASLQRLFGGKASRLAGRGPRALGLLLGVADLLLAAASGPGDWSVPKLNGPMASLVERVSGFLRVSVDPEVLDLKEFATSLLSKYKPLALEANSNQAPRPPRQQTLSAMFAAMPQ